jgi:D-alanine transfer protein
MNAPAHSGWWNHALAIGLAAVAAWFINDRFNAYEATEVRAVERIPIDLPLTGYFDTYKNQPFMADLVGKSLSTGSSILLMGSSELTTADHPSKPVNFFNHELHVPLLALGHAGNQSLSMHAQLLATGAELDHARIAILVSPSWFVDKSGRTGTELGAFLEYQPSPSLYRIQERIEAADPSVGAVSGFMAKHESELGTAQPVAQWITRDASWSGRCLYAFSQPWNAAIIHRTRARMLAEPFTQAKIPEQRTTLAAADWQGRYDQARADHLARCTNNSVFVNDPYYAEYVQGRTRSLDVVPFEENQELQDFIDLLDLLKAKNAQPFFVLQPLNPYVYINLKEVDPTIERIRTELDARQFRYLDLWVSDTADFRPGTLTDVMHLGPLGWYRIDSAMAAHFP